MTSTTCRSRPAVYSSWGLFPLNQNVAFFASAGATPDKKDQIGSLEGLGVSDKQDAVERFNDLIELVLRTFDEDLLQLLETNGRWLGPVDFEPDSATVPHDVAVCIRYSRLGLGVVHDVTKHDFIEDRGRPSLSPLRFARDNVCDITLFVYGESNKSSPRRP